MSALIDISVTIADSVPRWPGSSGASLRRARSLTAGDEATVSELSLDVHTGTHLDAPSHMLAEGASIDEHDLALGIGPTLVLDTGEAAVIDAELLESLDPEIPGGRLLLQTRNSRIDDLYARPFDRDFAALDLSGARWIAERGVRLVGIDYLSIQRFGDPIETHLELFRAGVTILEGLDLAGVEAGPWELICMPLSIRDAEAAPARAALRRLDG